MSTFTPLSTLLAARTRTTDNVGFTVPEDWLQGRTSFGGLISVLAVQAMRDVAGAAWPATVRLRALQTSFIGPVAAGSVEVSVNLLREGKNVRQVQALVRQQGQTAALLLGVFGVDRATIVPAKAPERPAISRLPEEVAPRSLPRGIGPNFTQHMDMRFAEGVVPMSGLPSEMSRIYLRLKDEPIAVDLELTTVLLAGVPPTPVLGIFTQRTPPRPMAGGVSTPTCWLPRVVM